MWGEEGGFTESNPQGGAGFMSPSQFSSPSVAKEQTQRDPVPVTIKMIKESSSDSVSVGGKEANVFIVVGSICSIDVASTKITYTIDDSTGIIQVVRWLESDSGNDDNHSDLAVDSYCKVVGKLRSQGENQYLMAFSVSPITDLNRLTTHLLEVIYIPLKFQEIQNMSGTAPTSTTNKGVAPSMDSSDANNMQGLSGPAKMVYQLIKMATEEIGTNKTYIQETLAGKVTTSVIENVLEHLSNEGLIFCTIDDEHFKTSDNY